MEKNITLTVNGQALHFEVNSAKHKKYINEVMPNNKVGPAENFLRRCIVNEDKEALNTILGLPGATMQLLSTIMDEFMPDMEIEVGK